MKTIFLFGFFSSLVIAAGGAITQQAVLAWIGIVAAGITAMLPIYAKARETKLRADQAAREAFRADCEYALECLKAINNDLLRRVATLERELAEWQRLYDAGSKDWPKMES